MARILIALVVAAACSAAIGCGGDDETTTSASSSTTSTTTSTEAPEPTSTQAETGPGNVNERYGFLPPDIGVDNREGTPVGGAAPSELEDAAGAAGCEAMLDLPDEGNTHFTEADTEVDYGTSPPTSGDHFFSARENGAGALADGAFVDTPPDTRVVHSLEHGRVAIQYSPDLPEEDQLALKGLFDADRPGVLLFPNPDMPYDVAATAWTQLLGCGSFEGDATLGAIAAFRDEFRGRGPEPVVF